MNSFIPESGAECRINAFFDKLSYRHDTVKITNQIYEPLPTILTWLD